MKNKVGFMFLFSCFFITLLAFGQQTENLTITTFYPSPFGVYQGLRLFPVSSTPACDLNNEGAMYYDDNTSQFMVCRQTVSAPAVFEWQTFGLWSQPLGTNNLYPNNNNWNVGIGTPTPQAKLDVAGEVKVGNTSLACSTDSAGAIRYDAGEMQYCDASDWISIGKVNPVMSVVQCTTTSITGGGVGGQQAQCTARCPTGTVVTGGGCEADSAWWHVHASKPDLANNGWYCNVAEDWKFEDYYKQGKGYAVCMKTE